MEEQNKTLNKHKRSNIKFIPNILERESVKLISNFAWEFDDIWLEISYNSLFFYPLILFTISNFFSGGHLFYWWRSLC